MVVHLTKRIHLFPTYSSFLQKQMCLTLLLVIFLRQKNQNKTSKQVNQQTLHSAHSDPLPSLIDHLQETFLSTDDSTHCPVVLHAHHPEVQALLGCSLLLVEAHPSHLQEACRCGFLDSGSTKKRPKKARKRAKKVLLVENFLKLLKKEAAV